MENLVTSFPPGTGLDYDYGDLVKALCTSTDWIDKPTDIASKITKLQDFLLLYLHFDLFIRGVGENGYPIRNG